MPTISVIVPVYKVEKYIHQCVDSILNQTFTDFELILVDDGSPDSCPQICDDYAKKDARVVVVHQENGGVSSSRNAGLAAVTGKYIMFVDSDDYIKSDMIAFLYNNLLKYDADISECSFDTVYENRTITNEGDICKLYTAQEALADLLTNKNLTVCLVCKLYKRELYHGITFPIGRWYEDASTTYKVYYRCKKIVYCQKPKYFYRRRENSITTSQYTDKKLEVLTANQEVVDFIQENCPTLLPQAQFAYINATIYAYGSLVKNKQIIQDNKEALKTLESMLAQHAHEYLKNPFLTKKEEPILRLIAINKLLCRQLCRFYFYLKGRSKKLEA